MKKVGLYIRVSTEEQIENYSIPAQKERLINYCKAKDWNIYNIYIDPGFSGKNLDRPAMQQLIEDVEASRLDMVLVYKLDRLSRSQKDTLHLIEDIFIKNEVDFVSMNESFDTSTPFGRAMIGVLSVFAQLEREQITERTSLGRGERAKSGLFHGGGFTPHGYDYINGQLVVNEYEALQINEIYDLYLQGVGADKIAYIMNQKYKNKYASWANHSSIRSVLESPIYIGKILWLGKLYEGQHQAIVDQEKWGKVQQLRTDRTNNKKSPFKATSLLTGILWCGNCGARYFAKHNTGHLRYYTCYSRANTKAYMIKDPTCKNKSWNINELDGIVEAEIHKLALDRRYFDSLTSLKPERRSSEDPINIITARINDLDKQIVKLMDLYQFETIPITEISTRIEKLYAEKKSLQEQLRPKDDLQIAQAKKAESAKALLVDMEIIWNNATLDERRAILASLINRIEIMGDNIKIEWAFV